MLSLPLQLSLISADEERKEIKGGRKETDERGGKGKTIIRYERQKQQIVIKNRLCCFVLHFYRLNNFLPLLYRREYLWVGLLTHTITHLERETHTHTSGTLQGWTSQKTHSDWKHPFPSLKYSFSGFIFLSPCQLWVLPQTCKQWPTQAIKKKYVSTIFNTD